jgi:DNA-binding response OmpR family regulator
MDVQLVHWPTEQDRRARLDGRRQARLLLVSEDASPPVCTDPLEDWIRLPAAAEDLQSRVRGLEMRAAADGFDVPRLDADRLLVYRGKSVVLPETEFRLAGALLERVGAVVSRDRLQRAGWPDSLASANTLDVQMGRLRRRLTEVELSIRTVRGRGYLLETA